MSESIKYEEYVAIAWYEGLYSAKDAQFSAEMQELDFSNIKEIYGKLYAKYEAMSQ